jgi:hypothetical protein
VATRRTPRDDLLGHTDAKLTLSVYQHVLDMGAGSIEVLEGVLGCSLQEGAARLCHRARRTRLPGDIAGHLDASALRRRFIAARDAAAGRRAVGGEQDARRKR